MKTLNQPKKFSAFAVTAFATMFALSACGGTSSAPPSSSPAPSASTSSDDMEPANLVGPGCEDYAEQVPDGAGSVEGMAADPVATAASNNPLLTTLTAAVSGQLNPEVDLVDTLNSDEYTVFAPVDTAFEKIDPATLEALETDTATLNSILTYHVIPGQISPDEIQGSHITVQGGEVTVDGAGDEIMVNGESAVICGGVQTANATVYLIDTVLMPPVETNMPPVEGEVPAEGTTPPVEGGTGEGTTGETGGMEEGSTGDAEDGAVAPDTETGTDTGGNA